MKSGEPSWTARRVAAQRLHLARAPAAYGRPEDDQRLMEDVAAGIDLGEARLAGYLEARTAFVDRALVDALDGGIVQVVLVAAGYDGRALRYARPAVSWFEIDRPETQEDKRTRMERLGLACPHVAFVPAEIGCDDLDAALARAGHDAGRPTLWICEGIAPYLAPDVLTGLLRVLRGRAAPRSLLVLELALVPTSDESRARREQLNAAVSEHGEPLRPGVARENLDGLLATCGWFVRRASDPTGGPLATSPHSAAFIVAEPGVRPQATAPGGLPARL